MTSPEDGAPGVIDRDTAEHYLWGGACDGWRLASGEQLSVIHERMPAGSSELRHYHERARQFFFVLEGTLVIERDGREHRIAAGQGLEVAPGCRHQALNRSTAPVEFLVISAPTTRGDRIEVA